VEFATGAYLVQTGATQFTGKDRTMAQDTSTIAMHIARQLKAVQMLREHWVNGVEPQLNQIDTQLFNLDEQLAQLLYTLLRRAKKHQNQAIITEVEQLLADS
jgi:formate dehydrogenase maturation protein FdhE